eukprot:8506885-Ditylum_brightwellii.AAC.1
MEIAGSDPTDAEKKIEEEKFKVVLLLKRLDPVCYDDLVEGLHRSVTIGRDEYPETTPAMNNLLTRRSSTFDSQGQENRPDRGGQGHSRYKPGKQGCGQDNIRAAFAQRQQQHGQTFDSIICHGCGEPGHCVPQCPLAPQGGWPRQGQMMQFSH